MSLEDRKLWAEVHKDLPGTAYGEGVPAPLRATRRGELVVEALQGGKLTTLAGEGSYFVACNPTPGTGVDGIAAADGLDNTEALIHLRNPSSTKRCFLDFILLRPTAAGTNGTNTNYAMKLDTGNSRYTSGGSSITPANPNMSSTVASEMVLKFGALVTGAATSSARLIWHQQVRSVIKVVGDAYLFVFGGAQQNVSPMATAGTAIANLVVPVAPVVLGQNDQFLLHEWAASQTVAASYEFLMGWWER